MATATTAETGKLTLHGELAWRGHRVDCPAGTPASVVCRRHEGSGVIPGLGAVTERYLFLNQTGTAECRATSSCSRSPSNSSWARKARSRSLPLRAPIACRKGKQRRSTFRRSRSPAGRVSTPEPPERGRSQAATPEFRRRLPEPGMTIGKDIWDGTVLVPGLAFDTTAPVVRGATTKDVVAPRAAKRAHVRYRLSALDETDGALPVTCRPPTGSLFKVGRTVVACSATDRCGNTGRARFYRHCQSPAIGTVPWSRAQLRDSLNPSRLGGLERLFHPGRQVRRSRETARLQEVRRAIRRHREGSRGVGLLTRSVSTRRLRLTGCLAARRETSALEAAK